MLKRQILLYRIGAACPPRCNVAVLRLYLQIIRVESTLRPTSHPTLFCRQSLLTIIATTCNVLGIVDQKVQTAMTPFSALHHCAASLTPTGQRGPPLDVYSYGYINFILQCSGEACGEGEEQWRSGREQRQTESECCDQGFSIGYRLLGHCHIFSHSPEVIRPSLSMKPQELPRPIFVGTSGLDADLQTFRLVSPRFFLDDSIYSQ